MKAIRFSNLRDTDQFLRFSGIILETSQSICHPNQLAVFYMIPVNI